jgi:DNA-directed RNA polymerase specialized sigma24 family protein
MAETTVFLQNCLNRLKRGDLSARDELIGRVSGRLFALADRMLRDFPRVARWEQADDVLQQAAMRMHQCVAATVPENLEHFFRLAALQIRRELLDMADRYLGPEGLGANHASAITKSVTGSVVPGNEMHVDKVPGPVDLAIWTEFHTAVEQLPEQEKSVFGLLWYHEFTHAEAAQILNISERQLRRHWQSARLRLRKQLPNL